MDSIKRIVNNRFLLIAFTIGALAYLLILFFSPRRSGPPPVSPPSLQGDDNSFAEFTNLAEEKVNNAVKYRTLVADRFPIYVKDFKTSIGITTSINIYYLKDDDPSLMRLEIYGISYINKEEIDPKKNPNVLAFKESYQKALSLIREAGIDPNQLIFLYGDRSDVRATSNYWVEQLKLLN